MKKQEILKRIDNELLDKVMGFCYSRTRDSYEAEELCSDIIYELVKTGQRDGEITEFNAFLWKVARNVYADFTEKKQKASKYMYEGDSEDALNQIEAEEPEEDESAIEVKRIIKAISFLTKAYRDVMVMYYFENKTTAQIAMLQNASETAIRQRLFSARNSIRSEVKNMEEAKKPLVLDEINFEIIGTGQPSWGDPRDVFQRQMSKHVLLSCFKNAKTATEVSDELGIPMPYVEEELDILTKGANGEYGLLKKLTNGRYGINFILFDKENIDNLHNAYISSIPDFGSRIINYVENHREEILALPYLNHKVDLNLILWANLNWLVAVIEDMVYDQLKTIHFKDMVEVTRPFSVFGYIDNGKYYGCGCDGIGASNICGYAHVDISNIYISKIKKHFSCGHDIGNDRQLQLAIEAINGIKVSDIKEEDKEQVAKAIEVGYLYIEGDMIYTKILVREYGDEKEHTDVWVGIYREVESLASEIAAKIAGLVRTNVPEYLWNEYRFANLLAGIPLFDAISDALIDKGYMTVPESGLGAEGCIMRVMK